MARIRLVGLLMAFISCASSPAEDLIYKCGNEYTNTVSEKQALNCKLISGGNLFPDKAKWLPIGSTSSASVYFDKTPILKDGNFLKSWVLWAYKEEQRYKSGEKFQSSLQMTLFNCKDRTSVVRQVVNYSSSSGNGEVTSAETFQKDDLKFADIVPGSIGEDLVNHACKAK